MTEIVDGERRVAAIVHDAALAGRPAFVDTATSYALMTLDNHRLSAQTSSLLRAVRESRARIQAAADDERRRIERDLHDGAQQRLVALRIKLELAAERTGDGTATAPRARPCCAGSGTTSRQALDEVRSLARGIYPAPLADRGLVEGLRAAALRNPLPTTVLAAGVGRHPREIESAAYFCCLEALQNAAKHAEGATRRGRRAVRRRRAALGGARRRRRLRPRDVDGGVGVHEHARPPGRGRRRARDHLQPRPRDARLGDHPASPRSALTRRR